MRSIYILTLLTFNSSEVFVAYFFFLFHSAYVSLSQVSPSRYFPRSKHWFLYILKALLLSLLEDPFPVLRIFYLLFSLHYCSCSLWYDGHTISFASVLTEVIDICSHRIKTSLLPFSLRNYSNRYLNITITLNWPWQFIFLILQRS